MIKFATRDVLKLSPSKSRYRDAVQALGGARAINARGGVTFADMVAAKVRPNCIIWLATCYCGDADYERRLRLWAADLAAHTLNIFLKVRPDDTRPAAAISAARAFARGEIDDAARAAAGAAARDAWDAAWDAAGDAEKQWQVERLAMWMSDDEPADWPVPEQKEAAA